MNWQDAHHMHVSTEVDYSPNGGAYWVPARVQEVAESGALLTVRFAAGPVDVTHTIDLRNPKHLASIGPIGSCGSVAGAAAPRR